MRPKFSSHTIRYPEVTLNRPLAFDDALDAAEKLDAEAQAELVAVISRRLAERGRALRTRAGGA